jgi:hypothetical protein
VADDPYSILGLEWGASQRAIRTAFRRLAIRYHPDRSPGDNGARFKLISAAYQRLKEANWSLPRSSAASFGESDHGKRHDPPPAKPTRWPDGTPIYYPSAEDAVPRPRKATRPPRFVRLGVVVERLSKGVIQLYFLAIAASIIVFILLLLFQLLKSL